MAWLSAVWQGPGDTKVSAESTHEELCTRLTSPRGPTRTGSRQQSGGGGLPVTQGVPMVTADGEVWKCSGEILHGPREIRITLHDRKDDGRVSTTCSP
jgi:hypothetical protein